MINIQRVSDTGNVTEVIEIDATLSVGINNSMTVTAFPVEKGATISDHARKLPVVVTVRALVSATPLRILSFNLPVGPARPRTAFEILDELQESKELVRIVTDMKTYDDMILTNWNTPRDKETKNALLFTATFEQLTIVSSQIVTLPPEEEVQETATVKEEGGKVTPAPTESEAEVEKASLLFRTLNGLGVVE